MGNETRSDRGRSDVVIWRSTCIGSEEPRATGRILAPLRFLVQAPKPSTCLSRPGQTSRGVRDYCGACLS
jgi:hypothetical protein